HEGAFVQYMQAGRNVYEKYKAELVKAGVMQVVRHREAIAPDYEEWLRRDPQENVRLYKPGMAQFTDWHIVGTQLIGPWSPPLHPKHGVKGYYPEFLAQIPQAAVDEYLKTAKVPGYIQGIVRSALNVKPEKGQTVVGADLIRGWIDERRQAYQTEHGRTMSQAELLQELATHIGEDTVVMSGKQRLMSPSELLGMLQNEDVVQEVGDPNAVISSWMAAVQSNREEGSAAVEQHIGRIQELLGSSRAIAQKALSGLTQGTYGTVQLYPFLNPSKGEIFLGRSVRRALGITRDENGNYVAPEGQNVGFFRQPSMLFSQFLTQGTTIIDEQELRRRAQAAHMQLPRGMRWAANIIGLGRGVETEAIHNLDTDADIVRVMLQTPGFAEAILQGKTFDQQLVGEFSRIFGLDPTTATVDDVRQAFINNNVAGLGKLGESFDAITKGGQEGTIDKLLGEAAQQRAATAESKDTFDQAVQAEQLSKQTLGRFYNIFKGLEYLVGEQLPGISSERMGNLVSDLARIKQVRIDKPDVRASEIGKAIFSLTSPGLDEGYDEHGVPVGPSDSWVMGRVLAAGRQLGLNSETLATLLSNREMTPEEYKSLRSAIEAEQAAGDEGRLQNAARVQQAMRYNAEGKAYKAVSPAQMFASGRWARKVMETLARGKTHNWSTGEDEPLTAAERFKLLKTVVSPAFKPLRKVGDVLWAFQKGSSNDRDYSPNLVKSMHWLSQNKRARHIMERLWGKRTVAAASKAVEEMGSDAELGQRDVKDGTGLPESAPGATRSVHELSESERAGLPQSTAAEVPDQPRAPRSLQQMLEDVSSRPHGIPSAQLPPEEQAVLGGLVSQGLIAESNGRAYITEQGTATLAQMQQGVVPPAAPEGPRPAPTPIDAAARAGQVQQQNARRAAGDAAVPSPAAAGGATPPPPDLHQAASPPVRPGSGQGGSVNMPGPAPSRGPAGGPPEDLHREAEAQIRSGQQRAGTMGQLFNRPISDADMRIMRTAAEALQGQGTIKIDDEIKEIAEEFRAIKDALGDSNNVLREGTKEHQQVVERLGRVYEAKARLEEGEKEAGRLEAYVRKVRTGAEKAGDTKERLDEFDVAAGDVLRERDTLRTRKTEADLAEYEMRQKAAELGVDIGQGGGGRPRRQKYQPEEGDFLDGFLGKMLGQNPAYLAFRMRQIGWYTINPQIKAMEKYASEQMAISQAGFMAGLPATDVAAGAPGALMGMQASMSNLRSAFGRHAYYTTGGLMGGLDQRNMQGLLGIAPSLMTGLATAAGSTAVLAPIVGGTAVAGPIGAILGAGVTGIGLAAHEFSPTRIDQSLLDYTLAGSTEEQLAARQAGGIGLAGRTGTWEPRNIPLRGENPLRKVPF
ncbi:MAG: hypothetical protein GX605_11390, partial [Chloroflexi bacterium]|nr:hypothetical protein [Chloroflexota bacterium]